MECWPVGVVGVNRTVNFNIRRRFVGMEQCRVHTLTSIPTQNGLCNPLSRMEWSRIQLSGHSQLPHLHQRARQPDHLFAQTYGRWQRAQLWYSCSAIGGYSQCGIVARNRDIESPRGRSYEPIAPKNLEKNGFQAGLPNEYVSNRRPQNDSSEEIVRRNRQ